MYFFVDSCFVFAGWVLWAQCDVGFSIFGRFDDDCFGPLLPYTQAKKVNMKHLNVTVTSVGVRSKVSTLTFLELA